MGLHPATQAGVRVRALPYAIVFIATKHRHDTFIMFEMVSSYLTPFEFLR